jgi:hypothetical protein
VACRGAGRHRRHRARQMPKTMVRTKLISIASAQMPSDRFARWRQSPPLPWRVIPPLPWLPSAPCTVQPSVCKGIQEITSTQYTASAAPRMLLLGDA